MAASFLRSKKLLERSSQFFKSSVLCFFSEVKPSKENCEVACICVKKGVKVALCGMKNINLKKTL